MKAYVVSAAMNGDYVIYGVYSTLRGAENRVESLKRLKFELKSEDTKKHLFSDVLYTDKFLSNLSIGKDRTISAQPYSTDGAAVKIYEFPSYEKLESIYVYIDKVALDEDIEQ